MANEDLSPVVIEELNVPSPLRVELRDTDLPFGRARQLVAFESGGRNDIPDDGIKLPGRRGKIFQGLFADDRPMVIRGAFRDHHTATPNHAREMRDSLEQIRRRLNLVRISWDGQERTGILGETKFGEEGPSDISYELTFYISDPVNGQAIGNPPERSANQGDMISSIIDTYSSIKGKIADIKNTITDTENLLFLAFDSLGIVLNSLAGDINFFLNQPVNLVRRGGDSARAVRNAANAASDAVQRAEDALNVLDEVNLKHQTAADTANLWAVRFEAEVDLREIFAQLREIKASILATMQKATRLYEVRPGDTLESIAQIVFGSKARAYELGVREEDVTTGKLLRIPEAA